MEKIEAINAIRAEALRVVTDIASDTDDIMADIGGLIEDATLDALTDWVEQNASEDEMAEIESRFGSVADGGVLEFASSQMLAMVETTLPDIDEKLDDITEQVIDKVELLSDESLEELSYDYDDDIDRFVDASIDGTTVSSIIEHMVNTGRLKLGINVDRTMREYLDGKGYL